MGVVGVDSAALGALNSTEPNSTELSNQLGDLLGVESTANSELLAEC